MTSVRIADLKANLSRYLRRVREGARLTVLDRTTPIAQLVPCDDDAELDIRPALRTPSSLRLPRAPATKTDSLALLLADRATR